MDHITKTLTIIHDCIEKRQYREVETERLEFKDLSTRDNWRELYCTACAFLNTMGGIIVLGIKDKGNEKNKADRHYRFTGFNYDYEPKLKQIPEHFTNSEGQNLNLSTYFNYEIRDFREGKIALVYVEELPDDQKYVFFENQAFQRRITGDHRLSPQEIEVYEEIKKDIIKHQELTLLKEFGHEALNIDTLNQYIIRYNQGKKKGETLKTSLENALSFLTRENFVRDGHPTLLGMLVCGNDVEKYIQGKCEADCYVISPNNAQIAESQEVILGNIVELIENSFNFIWRNIKIGIISSNSGTASPEYPQELIRESINNAFAHRNYASDRFVIVEIRTQESLVIRNPGMFEKRQRIFLDTEFGKIRRIIPIQVARNPKLAHLLKSFNYWEGRGTGLASLIDNCLDNEIDLPYYLLSADEIKLTIPKGKVYDDDMKAWLSSFAGYIQQKFGRPLNEPEKIIMSFFRKSELLNRLERYTILLTMGNNHSEVIADLEEKGLIFKNTLSADIYPVYQVDRNLVKDDFSDLLKELYQEVWDELKVDYQEVLNAIYLHNHFGINTESVSANSIGTFLYLKHHKKIKNITDYENFKRKVRNIFNQLENKNLIIRKDGKSKKDGGKPDFRVNIP
ncbi:MAG: putative DNA binding domain-containing protein [Microscillaceae bacterium]|nr:putative DNA binding domain-containing protein [Microscillaceae bacterium]